MYLDCGFLNLTLLKPLFNIIIFIYDNKFTFYSRFFKKPMKVSHAFYGINKNSKKSFIFAPF